MKRTIFLLTLSIISFFSKAQKKSMILKSSEAIKCFVNTEPLPVVLPPQSLETDSTIHKFVEQMPEFPGRELALYNFISKNIQYPDSAMKYEKERTVRVLFIVEKDGSLSNVVVKRPVSYGFDEEAIRLIKAMPKWKPGRNNGKPVRVFYQIPVRFVLE